MLPDPQPSLEMPEIVARAEPLDIKSKMIAKLAFNPIFFISFLFWNFVYSQPLRFKLSNTRKMCRLKKEKGHTLFPKRVTDG
jgi:hypothetical protein